MTKGILRVPVSTELSAQVQASLKQLLPDYDIERFEEQPDYKASFQRRVDSLYQSFLFLLDAYPIDRTFTNITAETLRNYADECKKNCDLNKNTVKELNKELGQFADQLISSIMIAWKWPDGRDKSSAVACLNEAEQYRLMKAGRPHLATLIPMPFKDSSDYVLQWDESIPPYTDQWLQELNQIKNLAFPKTSEKFSAMPYYQKAYFFNLDEKTNDVEAVQNDLNELRLLWQRKSNGRNLSAELAKINEQLGSYPSWISKLKPQWKAIIIVLASTPSLFEQKLDEFSQAIRDDYKNINDFNCFISTAAKIPEWYWALSNVQQHFLEHVVTSAASIKEAVSFLSSRHRTLPVPANFATHQLLKINKEGEIHSLSAKRYRSSHIVSRDVLSSSESVQRRHGESNLAKVTEQAQGGQEILIQTLISPIHAASYIPGFVEGLIPELPPDKELYDVLRKIIARSQLDKRIFQHNHPLNIAKYYYFTQNKDPDSLVLLEKAQSYSEKFSGLQNLIDDYQSVLSSTLGTATLLDYVGRELFLSSLEQLIVLQMGGFSYGSCVSGKDRKAIELIHTDAMLLYKEQYGSWPKFGAPAEEKERADFVNIVVALYCSRHQQEHAGQNAPGSEGIKTPNWYFPKDIYEAINLQMKNKNALKYDDALASNNELKYIVKHSGGTLTDINVLFCDLIAKQLGEEQCKLLYDALCPLINEVELFERNPSLWKMSSITFWENGKKNSDSGNPTGILAIRRVMQDQHAGATNECRMSLIFQNVISRPENDATRTAATNLVYNMIRKLLQKNADLPICVEEAVKKWNQLFEKSKEDNSSQFNLQLR